MLLDDDFVDVYTDRVLEPFGQFVLNDFMYSDAIIRRGITNEPPVVVLSPGRRTSNYQITQNGYALAELLANVFKKYGHFSIGYGYISPYVSERTVKWQDPRKPSYHRWDDGAACDIILHDQLGPRRDGGVWVNDWESPPILAALDIADNFDFSRMITYSESPSICIAAKAGENEPRRAFYENRYTGQPKAKPMFVRHNGRNLLHRVKDQIADHYEKIDWRGAGHPTYHIGGKRQYQHIRMGKYLTLLDCLKNPMVLLGENNRPPTRHIDKVEFQRVGYAMSRFVQWWYRVFQKRNGPLMPFSGYRTEPSIVERLFLTNEGQGLDEDEINWRNGKGCMIFSAGGCEDSLHQINMEFNRSGHSSYQLLLRQLQNGTVLVGVKYKAR